MKFRTVLILATLALTPAVSMAQWSANVGMMSDYIFRGYHQENGSAMAGLDYEHDSGFYAGTWWADVGDGVEQDLYFGYGGEAGDFSYGIGYTGYFYSDTWDSEYNELNLGIGWMGLSLDVAIGSWDGLLNAAGNVIPGTDDDYTFTALGYSHDSGLYITFGSWDWDLDPMTYDYTEIGYGFEYEGFDLAVAIVNSSDIVVSEESSSADTALTFSISRSFDLGN